MQIRGSDCIAPANTTGGPYTYLYNPERRLTLVGTCLDRGAVLNEMSDVHQEATKLATVTAVLVAVSVVTGFLSACLYRKVPDTESDDQPVSSTGCCPRFRRWWRVTCLGRSW